MKVAPATKLPRLSFPTGANRRAHCTKEPFIAHTHVTALRAATHAVATTRGRNLRMRNVKHVNTLCVSKEDTIQTVP
jgi:hypothetical protein